MNAWLVATAVLLTFAMPPCVWVACRDSPQERLAGLNLATTVAAVAFLLIAQGFHRSSYGDLGLVLAVLGPAGTLVFARLLGGSAYDVPARRAGDEQR
ncbi:MrpF/PhaF family protein [Streptantibioticus parmotrematis]|uniref:MrpF/PhaF family protein n=1 Tax=Streptantibioticus parmotrematis TaxID=2873249 RepID=UPI0033CE96D1